jgi:hypothetical protein
MAVSAVVTGSGKKYTRSASGLTLASTSITWCAWAKMTTQASYAMILASDDAPSPGTHYAQWGVSSGGLNYFLGGNPGGGSSAFNFTVGTWAFVAATMDRTNAESWLYYANAPVTTLARDFMFGNTAANWLDTNTFTIGGDGFGDPWQGSIAAVKVWNAVLTQTELEAEAPLATPVRTANLWGAWSFANGPQTNDESGNGRTLTAVGTPTTDASGPPISGGGPPPTFILTPIVAVPAMPMGG